MPDLKRAEKIGNEVLFIEAPATNLSGPLNGQQDAWRHARWNQRMAEETDWATAAITGYGYEIRNLYNQLRVGDNFKWDEMWMDLHNNREGRRIANTARSPMDLLNKGSLRTINPPNKGMGGLY